MTALEQDYIGKLARSERNLKRTLQALSYAMRQIKGRVDSPTYSFLKSKVKFILRGEIKP